MNKTLTGAFCLSLAASIWGGMFVVSKYVLEYIPPFTLIWIRYLIGFLVLYTILKVSQKKRQSVKKERKDWSMFIWIGFIGYFVSISCQFIGVKLADAHTGSLITATTPAFTLILARLFLKEKLTARNIIALLLATFGVIITIEWDNQMGNYLWGILVLAGAAVSWALLSVSVKEAAHKFSSVEITTYGVFFALIMTTPFAVWELQSKEILFQNTAVILGVIYLGVVSTAGAFFLWNKGMELMDAGTGSLFFFFQPIVGAFLGWLLLNEHIGINFVIGGFLILVGIFVITSKPKNNAARDSI
ncbi:EamA family transporter [Domibacillus sp. PGB-M46]|uniref:DMT family transporter n=1 Tax=Domibacillus sp. PGB-M46 TaxID=2910255 RepID=UPI001F5994DA|nr:EamA family transporter [Domibacillus sp. PGB-M46]MCI2256683.1 EamA family transporter [Domibacillus sp. PGB-M46]